MILFAALLLTVNVPRTWESGAVTQLEVPLANPKYSPVHISEEAYYRIPARTLYKTYRVYTPGREPAGYMEWLKQQEPVVIFDASKLHDREDWIRAGEEVFNAPTSFQPVLFSPADLRDMPAAKDGTIPFARWVIRRKGEVEFGSMGCNTCHTRVMPDGSILPGAQGNNPGDRLGARMMRRAAAREPEKILERLRLFARQFYTPWVPGDPNARTAKMSLDELIAVGESLPAGVTVRANTSMLLAPQVPDLIGVAERRFLDHTGLIRQRSIADLMRYSSLAQDVFAADRYGDKPAPERLPAARYSDEQLYALALYVYSLQPPPNPNPPSPRGQQIFEREGCGNCHTAPLYTNNKLIAVDGFEPSAADRERYDVMDRRVGTDPRYALATHKGTGYYKIPSLKGLWYRGPLEHNGSVASLEEWFDPARVTRVKGHLFGLKLAPDERAALIAFLRTL